MRGLKYSPLWIALLVLFASMANAMELNEEFFHGSWVVNETSCGSTSAEFIVFDKNGTFKGSRDGKAEIVGFWNLKDDYIDLHMVTSPAFFKDIHKDMVKFEDSYGYFPGRLLIFNQQNKSFLLITSELPEVLRVSDRIVVMHRGRITAALLLAAC